MEDGKRNGRWTILAGLAAALAAAGCAAATWEETLPEAWRADPTIHACTKVTEAYAQQVRDTPETQADLGVVVSTCGSPPSPCLCAPYPVLFGWLASSAVGGADGSFTLFGFRDGAGTTTAQGPVVTVRPQGIQGGECAQIEFQLSGNLKQYVQRVHACTADDPREFHLGPGGPPPATTP